MILCTFHLLQLWFTADNGAGSITSRFIPEMNNKLCDGAWHTITGKAKNYHSDSLLSQN